MQNEKDQPLILDITLLVLAVTSEVTCFRNPIGIEFSDFWAFSRPSYFLSHVYPALTVLRPYGRKHPTIKLLKAQPREASLPLIAFCRRALVIDPPPRDRWVSCHTIKTYLIS